MKTALIIFRDSERKGILRFLKAGFRHCFILVPTDAGWLLMETTFRQLHWDVVSDRDQQGLLQWYSQQGMAVVEYPLLENQGTGIMPVGIFSCVELVKRVLGIRNWRVQTPWRLFCFLKKIRRNRKIFLT